MSGMTVTTWQEVDPELPAVPDTMWVWTGDGYLLLPLSFFGDAALREIGREWTEALLARAAEQRAEGGGS